jgi:hypothetical protein
MANDRKWDYDAVEDVAIGNSARRRAYPFIPLHQAVVRRSLSEEDASTVVASQDRFVFRFKDRSDRLGDASRMLSLHTVITASHGTDDDRCAAPS